MATLHNQTALSRGLAMPPPPVRDDDKVATEGVDDAVDDMSGVDTVLSSSSITDTLKCGCGCCKWRRGETIESLLTLSTV